MRMREKTRFFLCPAEWHSARVKQIPEDFIVEEIIELPATSHKPLATCNQTYFWLTKKNWTTEAAISAIARACSVSYRRFKFAGTKDRCAITKQAISAFKIPAEKLNQVKIKDISIKIIGCGDAPLSLGDLSGNKFEIVIRDLAEKDLEKIKKNLAVIKKSGFKNFFGEQRFGKGNTHIVGREILKGTLETAVKEIICFTGKKESKENLEFRKFCAKNWGDWEKILQSTPKYLRLEKDLLAWLVKTPKDFAGALRTLPKHIRKLYVHAYQSWLWNSALSGYKPLATRYKLLAIPGFNTKLGRDNFSKTLKQLLAKDGLSLESFKCARMPELAVAGELRQAFVKPRKLKTFSPGEDELNKNRKKIKLIFELPKGCYATTLVQALAG